MNMMDVPETLTKAGTYGIGIADVEQSLENALRVINSWPAWKIASMLDSDSELPQEILEKLFIDDNT